MDASKIAHTLADNLLTPIPLCFALGIFSKLIHGGIKIPKELYYTIAIFLLMSIGFIGGQELAHEYHEQGIKRVLNPAIVTLFLGCFTPISTYLVMRYMGRMSVADAAGIAAHYGSTSAVTYAVANQFVEAQVISGDHMKADAYLPTLVTIMNARASRSRSPSAPCFRRRPPRPTQMERMETALTSKATCGRRCTK